MKKIAMFMPRRRLFFAGLSPSFFKRAEGAVDDSVDNFDVLMRVDGTPGLTKAAWFDSEEEFRTALMAVRTLVRTPKPENFDETFVPVSFDADDLSASN